MDIAGLRNPYDYANPVQSGECFAGRGAELATIGYVLDQAGPTRPVGYLALYGGRAAGKTSLLNRTETLAAERGYLVVRVSLVPGSADPAHFFSTVYEELVGAVATVADLTSPDGRKITPRLVRRIIGGGPVDDDFPLEFPENLAHARQGGPLSEMALRNDLRYLREAAGRPVVLLVDEAQLIAGSPDVLSLLRTLGMRLHGYVLVLAGTPELVVRINEVFDFLLRQFEFVKVERFVEVSDVVACMTRPLKAANLVPERCFTSSREAVGDDLMRLTDGNPYEIQLFCHTMFTRWQTGKAEGMELTAQTVDDVQTALAVGTEHQDRPLVQAIRRMSDDELLALNVWGSSLERATVDEIRFAWPFFSPRRLDQAALDRHLDQFVRDGLVELADSRVHLIGDTAEHIYARLSTVQRLGAATHPLISKVDFRHLLAGALADLLHHVLGDDSQWLLRTCCRGMAPALLADGLADLAELSAERKACFTVEYLHEAILDSGTPEELHLTTVECSYGTTTATRWICRAASDGFDLGSEPEFRAAQERAAGLGGSLRAERVTIPLRPLPEIVDWLVGSFPDAEARYRMSLRHVDASYEPYARGDIAEAFGHLEAAVRLSPHWLAANNLAYLNLKTGDRPAARAWAARATGFAEFGEQRALSRYNEAVAAALDEDWTTARERLEGAAADLADGAAGQEDKDVAYLMVPAFETDHVTAHESSDMSLPAAVARARDVVDLAERFARLRTSP